MTNDVDSYTSYITEQINDLSTFLEQIIESIYKINKDEIEQPIQMNMNKDIK